MSISKYLLLVVPYYLSLSIVGAEKNSSDKIVQNNVNIYEVESNEQNLIKFYDDHNIFILPSFSNTFNKRETTTRDVLISSAIS